MWAALHLLVIHPGNCHVSTHHPKIKRRSLVKNYTSFNENWHRRVWVPREPECHVLLVTEPGHQLGHNALASDGPAHLVAYVLIKDLIICILSVSKALLQSPSYFTVEFWLRLNAQHSEGRRHIEIPWDPDTSKVHIESHTPDWQPVCNEIWVRQLHHEEVWTS